MRATKLISFIFQFVTIGLAAAFLVLYLKPGVDNDPQSEPVQLQQAPAQREPLTTPVSSYADAVDRAAPAVVNIHSTKVITERTHPLLDDPIFRHFFGDNQNVPRQRMESSLGSGVIVSEKGYILTNNHVIAAADEILVGLRDGRSSKAEVVGRDPEADLAVLKIDLDKLPVITWSSDEHLRVGDVVLAIGNPFGVGQTVTSGIVSATGRDMLGISTFENFIQTDAAINPGNSGGALINAWGDLVGINTAIFSRSGGSQGIGFAIPVSLAKDVLQQIIQHGRVIRGWLGIAIQDVTPQLADSYGLSSAQGGIVSSVLKGGPADKAGLQPGDLITHINATEIRHVQHLLKMVSRAMPGEEITIEGLRHNKKFKIVAISAERPVQEE